MSDIRSSCPIYTNYDRISSRYSDYDGISQDPKIILNYILDIHSTMEYLLAEV